MNHIKDCIAALCNVPFATTIMGDFNFPNFSWHNFTWPGGALYECFAAMIIENSLFQFVKEPTRDTHILDLVLSTSVLSVPRVSVEEPFSISDHNTIDVCIVGEDCVDNSVR